MRSTRPAAAHHENPARALVVVVGRGRPEEYFAGPGERDRSSNLMPRHEHNRDRSVDHDPSYYFAHAERNRAPVQPPRGVRCAAVGIVVGQGGILRQAGWQKVAAPSLSPALRLCTSGRGCSDRFRTWRQPEKGSPSLSSFSRSGWEDVAPWRHRRRRSKRRCNGWPLILCRCTRQTHFASRPDCAVLHRTATGGRSDLKPQQYICSRVERKKD
jgi:hypothetical protein